jgi:Leucine-rich repeat (LRR) protein
VARSRSPQYSLFIFIINADLANNKLKAMAGLQGLSKLRKIDLGANRIRHMDPEQLRGLTSLEELWLGKNKIEKIEGLEPLKNLRRLDLQSNRLTSIDNLTSQVDTLEELYLSHNGIDAAGCAQPSGLALPFSCLTVLDVSRNRVETTEPFAHLIALEELWLSGNLIATFDQVQPASKLVNLETIYLEHNPVQGSDPLYRKTLAALIPNLKQIDANMISHAPSAHVAAAASASTSTSGSAPSAPAATSSSLSAARPVSDAEELRRLQEAAIQRAKVETEEKTRLVGEQQQVQDGEDGEGK